MSDVQNVQKASRKAPLSTIAGAHVREMILSKLLPAGSVVRPEDVGRELGISQTPAREALQTLKTEGFLQLQQGVGFVVSPLTAQDIRDIYTAQGMLAGEIAARAVTHASEDDILELEAIHFELLAASRRKAKDVVEERNHAFHRHMSLLSQAPKLVHLLGIVSHYVPRTFYAEVDGWVDVSAEDHQEIIDAFHARDPEAARRAMVEHMHNAGDMLARTFD
ncbi:MAG: GntR family transcriptional regulator [Corynebacterium sp.]|uniref:GntR family transcriptional regulator n=1 Tax=Corynebacterium sp. TaxID=1720 RepID=UPI0026E000D7|nr:GntR family transcriptional regulator [Corynebacterium sp.]MDO5670233.1 GntR family transcriptional regulator [Corynebacterium sp.]